MNKITGPSNLLETELMLRPHDKKFCAKHAAFKGVLTLWLCFLIACSNPSNEPEISTHNESASVKSLFEDKTVKTESFTESQALIQFTHIVEDHFKQLSDEGSLLREQLIAFTKKPNKTSYNNTIKAFEQVHARFVSGYFLDSCCSIYSPIYTSSETNNTLAPSKITLDQYPLLPGYLDVVEGYPFSGLIYSDISITRDSMIQEFQLGDPAYVTLGFHALEVILKGSNQNRKINEFSVLSSTSDSSTAPPELRRTLYAILLATEIEKDIFTLQKYWYSNLKQQYIQLPTEQADIFILNLVLKAEKALTDDTDNTQLSNNDHWSPEIQKLHTSLLKSLISIDKP